MMKSSITLKMYESLHAIYETNVFEDGNDNSNIIGEHNKFCISEKSFFNHFKNFDAAEQF